MKYISALGVIAGGFLLTPPPKAALSTIIWVVSRSHPVVSVCVLLALVSTWKNGERDD